MTSALVRPADFFDQKYGMDAPAFSRILDQTLRPGIDEAELYFEYAVGDSVSYEAFVQLWGV